MADLPAPATTRSGWRRWLDRARAGLRRGGEAGNALILMPVAVLIIIGFGAVAVDSALLFRARTELDAVASGLANDASSAVSIADFFGEDRVEIDRGKVQDLVDLWSTATASNTLDPVCSIAQIDNSAEPPSVTITCTGNATLLFRQVVGLDTTVPLTVSSTAELRDS